jgi:hypothetical protein
LQKERRNGPKTTRDPRKTGCGMKNPTRYPIDDPEHWRGRAEEARTIADQINDPVSRNMMFQIAEEYEKLAKRAETRLLGKQ